MSQSHFDELRVTMEKLGALTEFTGWEVSVLQLRDVLAKDRFDGIFAFSQGTAMGGFILALVERPHLFPPFLINGKPPHPPLKFGVFVAGYISQPQLMQKIFREEGPFSTPTLHVIGIRDMVTQPEWAQMLCTHYVPSKPHWAKFFAEFMRSLARPASERVHIPSPTPPGPPRPVVSKL
ncbi:hypothetical protein BOTBODRAFT_145850 [Botryobasidium botryosum FD-172 SS1]|uniref:Serine hydrolase domain-containing protein n=1 Tax=Botryobasidium botryosum (strain FD-172 SS1) TaxID=930990 RepID=A0A067MPZ6_BOTB1|nr:hypothetical protein BOTBODRAFT_145850 [Botryobasidium botryosum FD-172 SS1]